MKKNILFFREPILRNAIAFLLLGLLFLSNFSIKLLSDGSVSDKVYSLNYWVGWVFISAHIILLLAFGSFKILKIDNFNTIYSVFRIFNHYIYISLSILFIILIIRIFFIGFGEMDTLFPLFATLYIKPFSIWVPLSFITGLGIVIYISTIVKNVIDGKIKDNTYITIIFFSLIILTIFLALTDNGSHGLIKEFANPGHQYHEDVLVIRDMGLFKFIDNFIEIQYSLSLHTTGHPLFSSLFYYVGYNIFGYNNLYFALYTIFFGCLTVFPLFFLIKKIIHREAAIFGIGIFIFIPNVVIFTATSYDTLLMFFSCLTLTLYYYSIKEHSKKSIILSGISLFIYMLLTFHSLVIGLFIVGLPLYYYVLEKNINTIISGFYVALTTLTLLIIMHFLGYNYVESFFNSLSLVQAGNQTLTVGTYLKYFIGNILAYLVYLGIPIAAILLNKKNYLKIKGDRDLFIITIFTFAIILIMDIILLGHLEQERVWLFMVPFIMVFISKIIMLEMQRVNSNVYYFCFLFALFLQTALFQFLLETIW